MSCARSNWGLRDHVLGIGSYSPLSLHLHQPSVLYLRSSPAHPLELIWTIKKDPTLIDGCKVDSHLYRSISSLTSNYLERFRCFHRHYHDQTKLFTSKLSQLRIMKSQAIFILSLIGLSSAVAVPSSTTGILPDLMHAS